MSQFQKFEIRFNSSEKNEDAKVELYLQLENAKLLLNLILNAVNEFLEAEIQTYNCNVLLKKKILCKSFRILFWPLYDFWGKLKVLKSVTMLTSKDLTSFWWKHRRCQHKSEHSQIQRY